MKKQKKVRNAKKGLITYICVFVGIMLVCFLSGYVIVNNYLSKVNYESTDSSSTQITTEIPDETEDTATSDSPQDDDVYNIMFIGTDNRIEGENARSDSMILISINKKTSKIIMTSLLRDIYLEIPGVSPNNRLNAAYAYGGASLLLDTIKQNFKIKVDKYVSIDFYSFIDVIDAVGGVTINLSNAEVDVANDYITEINSLEGLPLNDGKITSSGTQNLTGKQALGYARNRYTGDGDFSRTDRQRVILEKVFEKAKGMDIVRFNDLLNTLLPRVTTNLDKGEFFSLMLNLPTYANYTLDSSYVPVEGSFSYMTIRGMSVIGIDFEKNINEINTRIYG